MHFGITNAKIVGFISTFVILVLSYLLLFYNTQKLKDQSYWVDHTNKVITNLEYLASENKEIEYNYRGYIALRTTNYYDKFYISVKKTDSLHSLLKTFTADSDIQQARLDTIKEALNSKVTKMSSALELFATTKTPEKFKDSLYGIGYTGDKVGTLRRQVKLMQYYEGSYLEARTKEAESFSNSIKIITTISLIIAFLLAISSFLTYRRENRAREEADAKSELYRNELEARVKELAEANKEIRELKNIEKFASTGRIARTIAHEVRNPLTNINLATEQLKESSPPSDENIMLLDMIKRNSLRINQLISNLLNATKFSELSFESVSLNDVIDQALELAEDRISLKHITIQKRYADNICDLKVDEDKMKIAFLNIVVNAIEAMEAEKGILKISTENAGNKCRIIFEDNGGGMNEETLSKIFEPFFTNKDNGNGLGMTNTQNIILNHKGRIEVESVEGKGTKFIISLHTED
jgi:signal transduction histidine kinase